jgi:hypothetical protein
MMRVLMMERGTKLGFWLRYREERERKPGETAFILNLGSRTRDPSLSTSQDLLDAIIQAMKPSSTAADG